MLHFRTVGEGRTLVIVHGLFGSGDNWATLAGKFPGYRVFLPDLRNHGNSPWFDAFSLADLASDLAEFHSRLGLEPCPWVGHSLGGKSVLELSLAHPDRVTGVAALDMTTRSSQARYPGFVTALRSLNLNGITSRGDAQISLEAQIPDRPTLQFLLKSLVPGDTPGSWRWKLNLDSLDRNYSEIWKALVPGRSWTGPALFLFGGASDYFQPGDEDLARIFFPAARFQAVPGAGHWLHAEKPNEVLAALNCWLKEVG